jgi:predicted heme/steroid binding protein/uncharacterized membrane protein
MAEMRKFTPEELAKFNGQDGQPAYIVHQGRVIDVTGSKMWREGMHMKRHTAGQDLTDQIPAAPHGLDVLERFPQVGVLVPSLEPDMAAPAGIPHFVERFLEKHPFYQRHPHPMTVHFPIVLMILAPLFTFLYLVTDSEAFEVTAINALGVGLLSCLVVIPTGYFTWWVNYGRKPMAIVTAKIVLSFVLFGLGLVDFIWRLLDPGILGHLTGVALLYPIFMFALLPVIALIGWYGALLTFPLHTRHRGAKERPDTIGPKKV